MKKNIRYVKLDMDDILEILVEHFQDQSAEFMNAKGIILGTPENELRFVGAFASECDEQFANLDLEKLDEFLSYNGDHAFLKSHPEFCL